jgi:hypothetical protein
VTEQGFHDWLASFNLHSSLHAHVADVLRAIPDEVRRGLVGDPSFVLHDYDPLRGARTEIPVGLPRAGVPGRAVALKRTLGARPTDFIRWVIAHELAHAHLRNEGRFPGDDPENAADALAASWGFPRPH